MTHNSVGVLKGPFLGYDPGGKTGGGHGVATLWVTTGSVVRHETETLGTVNEVLRWFHERLSNDSPHGVGMDTLTYWSESDSGWRGADAWLRKRYGHEDSFCVSGTAPERSRSKRLRVRDSVASPNSLHGSMSVSGMLALRRLRGQWPRLFVTETHPKVLYHALRSRKGQVYVYLADGRERPPPKQVQAEYSDLTQRNAWLRTQMPHASGVTPRDDHQWDALISAWAAYQSRKDNWIDLVDLEDQRMLDFPGGCVKYCWPESPDPAVWRAVAPRIAEVGEADSKTEGS